MIASIVSMLSGFLTKELILGIFKEVFLELILDIIDEYVESTENEYDDKLSANFREFLERRDEE